jgi:imidazolonepropionase-like amidohydrolase
MASIAFRNGRLIDSIADQPRGGASIVVEGERISAVGRAGIPTLGNATIVDLKRQTVLPGLIDTHVHTTLMDRESLPLFLAAGVTTARDVGGKQERTVCVISSA